MALNGLGQELKYKIVCSRCFKGSVASHHFMQLDLLTFWTDLVNN